MIVGHCHAEVVNAVQDAAAQGWALAHHRGELDMPRC